jgi:hypothetical protein
MKTHFLKMQSEHSALILFFSLIFAITGAIIAVLSGYPPPAFILASSALGLAVGGVISSRRESRFIINQIEPASQPDFQESESRVEVDFSLS